jgi:transcriptional regulator with XRE-family HTH domain
MAASSLQTTMNTRDEQFFKELGARIAQARKDHGMTQQQLADELGIAQQTLAHYEVGRARLPASMLPTLARLLTLSLDELMGQPMPKRSAAKRGPASRLQQQLDALAQLPKSQQQFVSRMIDTVLAEAASR